VMQHGKLDDPLLMLQEVFVDRWYEYGGKPSPNAVMLDIGANIGAVSLFWAGRSSALRIHAYEPNPSAFETLRANVEDNQLQDRVSLFREAIGRSNGALDLWVDVPTELSTAYGDQPPSDGGRKISVPMVGMEEVWQRLDRREIWLLKIDTEGSEGDILEGAPEGLLRSVQYAIVEYHDNLNPGVSSTCRDVLTAAGFRYRERKHPWDEGIIYATRQ